MCILYLFFMCFACFVLLFFFFFKQKTAYEMRISDWSSDVCSSDLRFRGVAGEGRFPPRRPQRVDRGERADRTGCVREESVQPIWHIERAVCVCRVGRAAAHDRGEPALQPGLRSGKGCPAGRRGGFFWAWPG